MAELKDHRRELFCRLYAEEPNATQAAIKAGYSEKTAKSQGARLLTFVDIQDRISEINEVQFKAIDLSAEMVKEELRRVGFAHMGQFAKWNENGVVLFDSEELTEEQLSAVAEVNQVETELPNGTRKVSLSIKLHPKMNALDKLCKVMGLYAPEKQEVSGPNGGPIQTNGIDISKLSVEELEQLGRIIAKTAPDS